MHGDLLRRQQRIVIRQPHGEQRVGHGSLVLRQRLLLGGVGGLNRGAELAAFVNGLNDLNARVPILIRLADTGNETPIASGSVYWRSRSPAATPPRAAS